MCENDILFLKSKERPKINEKIIELDGLIETIIELPIFSVELITLEKIYL